MDDTWTIRFGCTVAEATGKLEIDSLCSHTKVRIGDRYWLVPSDTFFTVTKKVTP